MILILIYVPHCDSLNLFPTKLCTEVWQWTCFETILGGARNPKAMVGVIKVLGPGLWHLRALKIESVLGRSHVELRECTAVPRPRRSWA